MTYVFEVVVPLISKTYGQELNGTGHDLSGGHWSWGFRTMPISVPGHADHPFRDDGDHDSGMMPITRSGMIPIS